MECFLSSTSARTGSFGVILIKNIFAVYVDDFLIAMDSDETEKWLLDDIAREFKIKALGLLLAISCSTVGRLSLSS